MKLSEFVRMIGTGKYEMRCTLRMGTTSMPEAMSNWRGVTVKGSYLYFSNGSRCDLPKARNFECDGKFWRDFFPGYREPTPEEQKVLDEWHDHASTEEFKQKQWCDAMQDMAITYWEQKHFFENKGMLYLMGNDEERGMILDCNRKAHGDPKYIRDDHINGDTRMEYEIREKQ